jgi:hypothetical protein
VDFTQHDLLTAKIISNYSDTTLTMEDVKDHGVKICDWIPEPLRIHCASGCTSTDTNISLVSNTLSFKKVLQRLHSKFQVMFERKAFIRWWSTDDMEFTEAGQNVIMKSFAHICRRKCK